MTKPSTRRERRRLEIRTRILEAAEQRFQASGYHSTTVAEICEDADVAYKTFFNHFPSKHDVLNEIEARGLETLVELLARVCDEPATTRDRILRFFGEAANDADAAGPMNRELLAEMIHSAHVRGDESAQIRRVVAEMERLVQIGLDQGDVRTDRPVETLAELIRGSYYVLMISFGNLDDYPIVDRARALGALVADGIVTDGASA
ncbi:MAG: TetR/AcrR family transcriptional regulator [bacterium]|nr:TetR/AcrR family transcriptional regulator [bacterium]